MVILALFTIPRWREWPKFDKKFLVVLFLWVAGAFISYYVFAPIDIPVEKTELPNFRWVFFFFAVVVLAKFYLDWNWLQKMLAVVFAVSFVVDLVLFIQSGGRASGLIYHPVNFANIIAPFVLISWAFVLQGFSKKQYGFWSYLHLFCVIAGSFLVLATQTRGVIIAFGPLMIILSLFYGRRSTAFALLGFSVFCMIAAFFISENFTTRMSDAFVSNKLDYSRTTRFAFWKANYQIWQEHQLFGTGYGINNFLYYDKLDDATKMLIDRQPDLKVVHAHSQLLQILAGGGVWGLSLFLSLLGISYCQLYSVYKVTNGLSRAWTLALGVAFACFLISGVTEANISVTKSRYIFVLLLGFIMAFFQKFQKQLSSEGRR